MDNLRAFSPSSPSSASQGDPKPRRRLQASAVEFTSFHGSVANIPVDAVAPPATTFVEDLGHRSLAIDSIAPTFVSSSSSSTTSSSAPSSLLREPFGVKVGSISYRDLDFAQPKKGGSSLLDGSGSSSGRREKGQASSHRPPVLPSSMPGYLEPNNHAFLRGTVAVAIVIDILRDLLVRNHVDSHFDAEKCKWKASRHTPNTAVDFRISMYECPKGNWCIEFQKRMGDFFLMRELFEQFLQESERRKLLVDVCPLMCSKAGGMHEDKGSLPGSAIGPFDVGQGFYLPPPPPPLGMMTTPPSVGGGSEDGGLFSSSSLSEGAPPVMMDAAPPSSHHFKPFICMAEAPCPLIRFEAAKALAQLSSCEDNRAMMKEAGAIPVLVKLLSETDDGCCMTQQAKQSAVMALSNLSASASCKTTIVESGAAPGLLELVSNPADAEAGGPDSYYLELETRREGARALANLCEEHEHATKVVSAAGKEVVSDWLKSVDSLRDERLHMHACRIRRMVRSCC